MIWTKGTHQSAKFETFDCACKISPNLYFDRLFLLKVNKFQLKNIEDLCLMTHNSDAKFEEKLTCGLENEVRNSANFYQSTRKSQDWDFDGILISKVKNV